MGSQRRGGETLSRPQALLLGQCRKQGLHEHKSRARPREARPLTTQQGRAHQASPRVWVGIWLWPGRSDAGEGWSMVGETARVGGSQSKMSSSAWWAGRQPAAYSSALPSGGWQGLTPAGLRAAPPFPRSLGPSSLQQVPYHLPASFSLRSTSSYTSMASSSKSRLLS